MQTERFETHHRPRFHVKALVVAGAVALLAAGCGSSSKTGSAGTGSPGTAATTGTAKGSPIAVGSIGSYSGPEASSLVGTEDTVKAWVDATNAAGGLDGHPIKLYLDDDGGNVSTAVTDVQTLITDDHVVAIVGDASSADTAWAAIAQKAGVPVIGGIPISLTFGTNPDFFAGGANLLTLNYGSIVSAKKLGSKMDYLYCAEIAQCKQGLPLVEGLGEAAGVGIPYEAAISASAPDYTATCQAIKSSGAASYEAADNSAVDLRVADQCKQEGVTAKLLVYDGTVTPGFATNAGVDGFVAAEADAPFFDDSIPATKAFHAALAKYAPNDSSEGNPDGMYMWVAGGLFNAAVKAADAKTVTAASVLDGLYDLKGETLGGLTPPITYTKGQPSQVDCYFLLSAHDGKFTEPQGLKTSCAPAPLIAAIFKKV